MAKPPQAPEQPPGRAASRAGKPGAARGFAAACRRLLSRPHRALRVTRSAATDAPGEDQAMVSARPTAIARRNVAAQAEPPHRHAALQASGRREGLSLSLVPEGGEDSSRRRCDQVDDRVRNVTRKLPGLVQPH